MIERQELENLYIVKKLSMMQIAHVLHCSPNKVVYWMGKYHILRRSISDAVYQRSNPNGDPFLVKKIVTVEDQWLQGMGLGLYWGEGAKTTKHSLKVGNTDPELIKMFMQFLVELYGVKKASLRFHLQIFTDIDQYEALDF